VPAKSKDNLPSSSRESGGTTTEKISDSEGERDWLRDGPGLKEERTASKRNPK